MWDSQGDTAERPKRKSCLLNSGKRAGRPSASRSVLQFEAHARSEYRPSRWVTLAKAVKPSQGFSLRKIKGIDVLGASGQTLGSAVEVHRPDTGVVVDNVFVLNRAENRHGRVDAVRQVE